MAISKELHLKSELVERIFHLRFLLKILLEKIQNQNSACALTKMRSTSSLLRGILGRIVATLLEILMKISTKI